MTIERSESIKELATALAKAQAALRPASKDAVNPHFKSKYADLGAVWEACREPLSSNGLSVVQLPADSEPGRLALTTMLMHSSGEYLSTTYSLKLQQDTAHGAGSALTYLRRYALAALVGVVADEDDDGNSASQPAQRAPQRPQQARPNGTRMPVVPRSALNEAPEASYEPPPTTLAEIERDEAAMQKIGPLPQAPAANGKKPPTRAGMLQRIAELTVKAEELDLEIELKKPVDQMTESELVQHGRNLNAAIAEAEARDIQPVAA